MEKDKVARDKYGELVTILFVRKKLTNGGDMLYFLTEKKAKRSLQKI